MLLEVSIYTLTKYHRAPNHGYLMLFRQRDLTNLGELFKLLKLLNCILCEIREWMDSIVETFNSEKTEVVQSGVAKPGRSYLCDGLNVGDSVELLQTLG